MPDHQKEAPTVGVETTAGDAGNALEADIVSEAAAQRKRFQTLQARAARTGNALDQLGGGYLLHQGAYSRHFNDLDTAEALIVRMEGGRA